MQSPVILKVELDDRPVSQELEEFLGELDQMTDKITLQFETADSQKSNPPCVRILSSTGEDTGIAFHGVPGGHEFNSFVIGLYNAAGPGQELSEDIREKIDAIKTPVDMKLLVSLSCTKCPELVMAAQRIAAANPVIRAEAYDLNHFSEIKDQFKVMSVPCLVVNDQAVSFGKKNIKELVEYLNENI